jgi:predicted pyridoxine 5'-phosphate oxidase superfamily flavin-nucleotide-binding protein
VADYFDAVTPEQRALIEEAPVFFVATADPGGEPGPHGQGSVNVSPKGATTPVVLDERTVAWLDYAGSGDETARHVEAGSELTLMVMSTTAEDAAIVRLYGSAEIQPIDASPHADALLAASRAQTLGKPRRVFVLHVATTMTSCGYGVPVLEERGDREKAGLGRRFKPPLSTLRS